MDDRGQDPKPIAGFNDVEVGEIIAGKYRIERLLGRGGMGSVWLATHLVLGERVAVKVMSRKIADNAEIRARFEREARASAKIKSRFVARVYDTGSLPDDCPYFVMEFMEGETLAEALKRTPSMSLVDTVRILGQVGRGLARAHELGSVHRDIKPDNVFLAHTSDDGEIAKVFDFGIVKMANAIADDSETQEGALLGTPHYMSPEQIDGQPVDFRSDLYSLGVMAYRMLTGKRLFGGDTLGQVLMKICSAPLPSIVESAPDVPVAVDAWFYKTCARAKDARYASAMECVDALVLAAGITPAPEVSLPLVGGGASLPPGTSAANLLLSGPPADTAGGVSSPSVPFAPLAGFTGSGEARRDVAPFGPSRRKALAIGAAGLLLLLVGAITFARSGRSGDDAPASGAAGSAAAIAPPILPAAPVPPAAARALAPTTPESGTAQMTAPAAASSLPAPPDASIGRSSSRPSYGGGWRRAPAPAPARPQPPAQDKPGDDRIHDVGY